MGCYQQKEPFGPGEPTPVTPIKRFACGPGSYGQRVPAEGLGPISISIMSRLPTILIVDDDEGHSILIRTNFADIGMPNEFIEFRDGQSVLDYLFSLTNRRERFLNLNPFVLLLDIRMPKVDGIEVLRRVKSDPDLKMLPVIMLSTTDNPDEVNQCHRFGCSAYVKKPVDYESFSDVVRRLGEFMKILVLPRLVAW